MKNKTTLNIILFISIIALASAYFIEYVLDYKMDRWEGLVIDSEAEYKEWKKKMIKGVKLLL